MRIECTQCDYLKNGDCSVGKNINHSGYCKYKHPAFDISSIGNMIHVSEQDYNTIKEAIINCAEQYGDEVDVTINDITFIVDIDNVDRTYETVKTGVVHMGYEETYQEQHINSIRSTFRGAYNKDGDEIETDFLNYKIALL